MRIEELVQKRWFRLLLLRTMVLMAMGCGKQDPSFTEDTEITSNSSDQNAIAGGLQPESDNTAVNAPNYAAEQGSEGRSPLEGGLAGGANGKNGGDRDGSDQGDDGNNGGDGGSGDSGSGDGGSGANGSEDSGSDDDHVYYEEQVTQQGPGKVDILWVVDSSGSMSEEQSYLGDNFNAFITEVANLGIDFQTAVTSTDICDDTQPADLALRSCPTGYGGSTATRLKGMFVGDSGNKVLTDDQPDLVEKFNQYTEVGIIGSGFEHGLKAAEMGVAKSLAGENEPLVRDDAFLAVIVVSDEEDDGIGLGMTDAYNGYNFIEIGATTYSYTDDHLIDYLQNVKGSGKFSISTITGTRDQDGDLCSAPHSTPLEEGTQYISASSKTGGIVQSICDTDWSDSLAKIGVDLNAQIKQVALKHVPKPSTIKVRVNDVLTTEWSFQSGSNAVKFSADHIPAEGDVISINYYGVP